MPFLYQESISRRAFLKGTSLALGMAAAGISFGCAEEQEVRWAFLADTHIPAVEQDGIAPENHYHFAPHGNLRGVVAGVRAAAPDGAMVVGDLARTEGLPGDYAGLQELLHPLAGTMPVLLALGNHDHRANFNEVFEPGPDAPPVEDKSVLVVEAPPVRLIVLDSLLYTNKVAGLLGKEQRAWLETYLQEADDTPTLLCVHHTLGDGDTDLLDTDRLFALVGPHRQVKAILYGHSHRFGLAERDGIHLVNLPAVGYSFDAEESVGWLGAHLRRNGGTFTRRSIDGQEGETFSLAWRT